MLRDEQRVLRQGSSRPVVLWVCAVILGMAAGLNYIRTNYARGTAYADQAQARGFGSGSDYVEIAAMLDDNRITSLSDHQRDLLTRYAEGSKTAPQYVAGILQNVRDDRLALELVPLARTLRRRIPDFPILASLPDIWENGGCSTAAAALRKDTTHR